MSVQSEITRIQTAKRDSLEEVGAKGVEVPPDAKLDDLPGLIRRIPKGGQTAADLPATVPPGLTAEPNAQAIMDALNNQGLNTVKYTPQGLSPEKQAQVRNNIGANEVSVQKSNDPIPGDAEIVIFTDEDYGPIEKTPEMTQPVGQDPETGRLFTATGGETGGVWKLLETVDLPDGGPFRRDGYHLRAAMLKIICGANTRTGRFWLADTQDRSCGYLDHLESVEPTYQMLWSYPIFGRWQTYWTEQTSSAFVDAKVRANAMNYFYQIPAAEINMIYSNIDLGAGTKIEIWGVEK